MTAQLIADMLDLPASSHCTITLFEIRLQRVQLQIFRNQKAPVVPHTLDLFLEGVVESLHLLRRAEIVEGGRTILPVRESVVFAGIVWVSSSNVPLVDGMAHGFREQLPLGVVVEREVAH
jgi:hypothetical protein